MTLLVNWSAAPVEFLTHKNQNNVLFFRYGSFDEEIQSSSVNCHNSSKHSQSTHTHRHRTEQQQRLTIWIELTRNGSCCQKLLEERKQNHLQPSMEWNVDNASRMHTEKNTRCEKLSLPIQVKIKSLQIQHGFYIQHIFPVQLFLHPCRHGWLCSQCTSKTGLCGWNIILSTSSLISH